MVTPLECGVRVGGAVEFAGLDAPPNFARAASMLAKAKRFMPRLRTEGGTQSMGFRPSLPDSLPVIGPSTADDRVIYAFGHGHLGLTQSAATARLVADILAGRPPPLDLLPLRPQRFGSVRSQRRRSAHSQGSIKRTQNQRKHSCRHFELSRVCAITAWS